MIFLYNTGVRLYFLLVLIAGTWSEKARKWISGRKETAARLSHIKSKGGRNIWVHCSSAGEFEQGKPIIESIKKEFPGYRIIISFFSPSGYETARNYPPADDIIYLPLDTAKNAKAFLDALDPVLVVFVKYEYWYHFLSQAWKRKIPVLLVSAAFRVDQVFFRPYGAFFKKILDFFSQIFVQDQASLDLLRNSGIKHCRISGDTRFDRVGELAETEISIPVMEDFARDLPVLVAGSTWKDDEELIRTALKNQKEIKLVIAPHEVHRAHIDQVMQLFPGALKYSLVQPLYQLKAEAGIWSHIDIEEKKMMQEKLQHARILVIDNVGMLSRLYKYADFTYVGGGFTKDGIHNVLEPAAFGKPVIFGPNFSKYREALALIEAGGGFSISESGQLETIFNNWRRDPEAAAMAGKNALQFIGKHRGATAIITNYIQEKRLLTRL